MNIVHVLRDRVKKPLDRGPETLLSDRGFLVYNYRAEKSIFSHITAEGPGPIPGLLVYN